MHYGDVVQHLHLSPATNGRQFVLLQAQPPLASKEVYFNCRKDGVLVKIQLKSAG